MSSFDQRRQFIVQQLAGNFLKRPIHTGLATAHPFGKKSRTMVFRPDGRPHDSMFAAKRMRKPDINLETYVIEDDEIGQLFAELLTSRQRNDAHH